MKLNSMVEVRIQDDEDSYTRLLNSMGRFLESQKHPPDHWIEEKRDEFYKLVKMGLTKDAKVMICKLVEWKDVEDRSEEAVEVLEQVGIRHSGKINSKGGK